ncbi:MAG: hypothetical protein LQ343_004836 [Gyalolechia ehrenbergii]|nr:MAG: hypothetical protein LQ343_004836 [Gyalolechia ehrenbergii]
MSTTTTSSSADDLIPSAPRYITTPNFEYRFIDTNLFTDNSYHNFNEYRRYIKALEHLHDFRTRLGEVATKADLQSITAETVWDQVWNQAVEDMLGRIEALLKELGSLQVAVWRAWYRS